MDQQLAVTLASTLTHGKRFASLQQVFASSTQNCRH